MEFFVGVLFGVVQGLTEFLPVSSSGHLVIVEALLPTFNQPGILFEVVLHVATLLAVLYKFSPAIRKLSARYLLFLIVGTIPAAIVGLWLNKSADVLFANLKLVGVTLLVTGLANLLIGKLPRRKKVLNVRNSLVVGLAQAVAILPGISRSGATIFAGRFVGLPKQLAAEFSFLLSVPAILGATFLQLSNNGFQVIAHPALYIGGFVAAFVSGVVAINLVLHFLHKDKFVYFGVYCLLLGLLVLAV